MTAGHIQCHASNYTKGRRSKIDFIVMHYTGNNGDTARGNVSYFSQPNRKASAHYFVDEKEIWLSVAESDTAWHCGAKAYKHPTCRNANSIGIEMCSRINARGDYYIEPQTVQNAIKLARHLMAKYGIPVSRILRHYDVTGKSCPRPWVQDESQWRAFLDALEGETDMTKEQTQELIEQAMAAQRPAIWDKLEDVPVWGRATVQRLINKGLLSGNKDGNLELNLDQLRVIVINDRAGLYGK